MSLVPSLERTHEVMKSDTDKLLGTGAGPGKWQNNEMTYTQRLSFNSEGSSTVPPNHAKVLLQ
jgi:hypothetical protein